MSYRKEATVIIATSVCFFLFAYFMDFTVDKLVNVQTFLLKMVLSQSGTSSILSTLSFFFSSFAALIFLVLGFMFLAGYAVNRKEKGKFQKFYRD